MPKTTSWEKVSTWYSGHLKEDTYHTRLIFPQLIKILEEFFPNKLKTLELIDLACGNALWAKHLSQGRKITYTGVDISPTLLKEAKEIYPGGKFIEADILADQLPELVGQTFDIATCILALQNVNKLSNALVNAQKLLNPGGYFVAVITHPAFRIPKQADWGTEDYPNQAVFRKVYHYLTPLEIEIADKPHRSMHEHFEPKYTYTYHRPMFAYINKFAEAGLPVMRMAELAADKKSEDSNPWADAEDHARKEIPMFMILVGKKI